MNDSSHVRPTHSTLRDALWLCICFAAVKLALTFALTLYTKHLGYGYFRDEFYYIACGRHLAWGYVDHGPIVALQARLGELLFGDSVFAIRILSALAGSVMVFLAGIIAWALGGRRPAQSLCMLALLVVPQYIGTDGILSMNSFEPVFWSLCILSVVLIARGAAPVRWWSIFGISAGLGLLNKPSMTFFLIALGLGLLVTPQRRLLFTRWAALAIALLVLIALPNVLWQIHNHWPTLEFLHNDRVRGKNAVLGPVTFFIAQVLTMLPTTVVLWVAGIVALLRAKSIPNSRWLGFTYLFFYAIMYALHAKDYYLAGIYPAFFAAGAIAWEHRFARLRGVREEGVFAFPVYESVLVVTGLLVLPLASPVLRPQPWIRYTHALHLVHEDTETMATGPLPQFFADRFGWQEQVDAVEAAYRSLSPLEQQRVCIFASNYGEAGAIDFLGRLEHANLPAAISGHNNYWLWGTHGCDPNIVIAVIGDTPDEIAQKYQSVTEAAHTDNPYSMPFEHRTIYILRNRRASAPFNWADERFYF